MIYRKDIASAENPDSILNEKMESYRQQFMNPFVAAKRGYIDDVIFPSTTRHHLKHLVEYAIEYFKELKKKYGKGRERNSEIRIFDEIEATKVA